MIVGLGLDIFNGFPAIWDISASKMSVGIDITTGPGIPSFAIWLCVIFFGSKIIFL